MKKILWGIFLLFLFIFLTRAFLFGAVLEPILAKKLTGLFGMPVSIRGLRADPVTGGVRASRVIFMNQPEFAPGPHLDVKGIRFTIDFPALAKKHVRIGTIFLNEPYYFIDRIATPTGPNNNVSTWVHHIEGPEEEDADEGPEEWKVTIGKIVLHRGTFILHDRSSEEARKRLVFEKLEGFLADFEWPSDPSRFPEKVELKGTFGEKHPAPFTIRGTANFATGKVGFDLKGDVPEGSVIDHEFLWQGMSIRVTGGKYRLKVNAFCRYRKLKSQSLLDLHSLKVRPRVSAGGFIWGFPMMATVRFLETQKTIHLKVLVHGNIKDPEFEFTKAFRRAFQESLARHTRNGLRLIGQGSSLLAAGTQELVRTPTRLAEGLEKMTTIMTGFVPGRIGSANGKARTEPQADAKAAA